MAEQLKVVAAINGGRARWKSFDLSPSGRFRETSTWSLKAMIRRPILLYLTTPLKSK